MRQSFYLLFTLLNLLFSTYCNSISLCYIVFSSFLYCFSDFNHYLYHLNFNHYVYYSNSNHFAEFSSTNL